MANQFIDKVNKAYEDGLHMIPGIDAVSKFYDEYGKKVDDKSKKPISVEIGEIRTDNQEKGTER